MTGVTYDDLVAVATVGLSHRTLPLTGPSGAALSGVPAEHVAALKAGDQGTALLDAAALMVSARRAGARPAAGVAYPEPAPADQAPELPAPLGRPAGRRRSRSTRCCWPTCSRRRAARATGPRLRCCRCCWTRP